MHLQLLMNNSNNNRNSNMLVVSLRWYKNYFCKYNEAPATANEQQ